MEKIPEVDPDDLLSKFKEKLSCHRPTSDYKPWVFWSPTNHSSCLPPPDSVGIKNKIKSVLLKLSFEPFRPRLLIQFWAAITTGGQCSLTTSEQPFALTDFFGIDKNLCLYRNNSVHCEFIVDGESEEEVGFPVRAFRQQLLESTPDVRYYSIKQHPWCNRDIDNISLVALPVFDPVKCCAGVLELVSPCYICDEVDAVCKALEAVDLKCLGQPCNHFDKKIRNKALHPALDEVMKVLEVVCETHKLPLAQTWVPCKQCNSEAISSFRNKSPRVTLSNIYNAGYVQNFDNFDINIFSIVQTFQLQEDQGVVGSAYLCRNSSFCRDITQFSLTEYPMVYWAHHCKLFGCFAICLKSSHTGEDDYILEFFLPSDEIIYEHPRPQILGKILETMKQHFRSFKVASGEPLGVELFVEVINNGRDIGSTELSDAASRCSGGNGTTNTSMRTHKITRQIYSREKGTRKTSKRKQEITREVLEQNFGRNFGDVAKSFNVSVSTLKCFCGEHGIPNWPHLKIDKVNYSLSNMEPACSNVPHGQATATAAPMMPHVTTMQDVKTVDIKAAYKGTLIRFKLPPTAGMVKLEEEIVKRLTSLQVGCFKVTYLDEDNDSILLACDTDLQYYINTSIASGITKIRMFIELETNRQP